MCGIRTHTERLRYDCNTSDPKKTQACKEYEKVTAETNKKVTDTSKSVTLNITEDKGNNKAVTEIFKIGKIDTEIYKEKFGQIQTDEVIVTNERIEHIKLRHPEDYALFEQYGRECIISPDMVIRDEKNAGTAFLIKKLPDTNLNVVLRLVLENEDSNLKNSVMTFWRIRERNLKKLINKNQLIYKKE